MATATVDGGDELRSAARERESRGGREGTRESERVQGGGAWRLPGHPDEEGRGQAGREAGGVARRRARALGTCLADWRQEDDGGGGLGWPAGPEAPGKKPR